MKLSPIQEKIVETPGNLIVRASAGTGKTHTMVNKIAKEIPKLPPPKKVTLLIINYPFFPYTLFEFQYH